MNVQERTRMNEIFSMSHNDPRYYSALDELKVLVAKEKSEVRVHNIATTAAFMMEGLRDLDYSRVLEIWDQGCFELVFELTSYAEFMSDLFEAELAMCPDGAPGMYDYEVTNEFGSWFGSFVLITTHAPSEVQCKNWIQGATDAFFNQR